MAERDLALANREGRLDDFLKVVTLPNPLVSANTFTFTPPGGEIWRPLMITWQSANSGTVGARGAVLSIDDGTTTVGFQQLAASQPASTTARYTFGLGLLSNGGAATPFRPTAPILDLPLLPGWNLTVTMFNNAGGDQLSAIAMVTEVLTEGVLGKYGGISLVEQVAAMAWDAQGIG